jgi:hypothetical protein
MVSGRCINKLRTIDMKLEAGYFEIYAINFRKWRTSMLKLIRNGNAAYFAISMRRKFIGGDL